MFCDREEITEPTERKIAWFVMLNGSWREAQHTHTDEHGKIFAVEYHFDPEEIPEGQKCHVVGNLSTMFVRSFLYATTDKEAKSVRQLYTKAKPGALGRLIPKGYRGKVLPLWILHLVPTDVPSDGIAEYLSKIPEA